MQCAGEQSRSKFQRHGRGLRGTVDDETSRKGFYPEAIRGEKLSRICLGATSFHDRTGSNDVTRDQAKSQPHTRTYLISPLHVHAVAHNFCIVRHSGEMLFTVIRATRGSVSGDSNPSSLPDTPLQADDLYMDRSLK